MSGAGCLLSFMSPCLAKDEVGESLAVLVCGIGQLGPCGDEG